MTTEIWVNIGSGNGSLPDQAITWTKVDWSSLKSSDIHIRAISQKMPQPSITKICLKNTYLKFHSNFPGANELKTIDYLKNVWTIINCYSITFVQQLVQADNKENIKAVH